MECQPNVNVANVIPVLRNYSRNPLTEPLLSNMNSATGGMVGVSAFRPQRGYLLCMPLKINVHLKELLRTFWSLLSPGAGVFTSMKTGKYRALSSGLADNQFE